MHPADKTVWFVGLHVCLLSWLSNINYEVKGEHQQELEEWRDGLVVARRNVGVDLVENKDPFPWSFLKQNMLN